MIVIDASVAAKWIMDEADSPAARKWLKAATQPMHAPDLMLIEVARALVRRVNMKDVDDDVGDTAIERWATLAQSGSVTYHRTAPAMLLAASRTAIRIGHPLADCIYLALADVLNCDLITADAKFLTRAGVHTGRVKLLSEVTGS